MRLCVFLGLLCLQRRALGQDSGSQQGSEQVRLQAFCDDAQVTGSVEGALDKFNDGLKTGQKLALHQILQATKADNSSGTMVHVEFNSRKSSCPAGDAKPWKECDYLPTGPQNPSPCIATVYVTETEIKVQAVYCELEPRIAAKQALCLGCSQVIDVDSEDLKAPLTISLNKFNAMSDSTHFFVINSLAHATRQVVAGFRYRLMFDMRKSNCAKADNEKMSQECVPDPENVELANCNSTVDVAPWRHEAPETDMECGPGPVSFSRFERRRPSGWTPLRHILMAEPPASALPGASSSSPPPPSPPAVADSSEESQDKRAPPPNPLPTEADGQFRCPSKPWKEFVYGGPAPPQPDAPTRPAGAPVLPPSPGGFSDLDLLG